MCVKNLISFHWIKKSNTHDALDGAHIVDTFIRWICTEDISKHQITLDKADVHNQFLCNCFTYNIMDIVIGKC